MTMLARIEASDSNADRRRANRRVLRLQVVGMMSDRPGEDVLIHDLSASGLLIETSADLAVGARLEIELPEAGRREARVVWGDGRYFGCQFGSPVATGALSAAQLRNPVAPVAEFQAAFAGSAEVPIERLPLPARVQIIGALALGTWALVLIPIAMATHFIF